MSMHSWDAGLMCHGLSRTDLEAIVRRLLFLIEENGYGLFKVNTQDGTAEWSYMVRKPVDVKINGTVIEMTDPRMILHDPRASGALLFSAYQFLV